MSTNTTSRSVTLGELPSIAYEHATRPDEAHDLIRQARAHGPIAMGPHGPEILSYELARFVLRDNRFAMPRGLALAQQGLTSGELWDIVCRSLLNLNGEEHHRQRRIIAKAFTPRAAGRLRGACTDIITELASRHSRLGRCDVVADIARQYPIPVICALLGTPRADWQQVSDWADDVFKLFDWNVVQDEPDIVRAWNALETYLDDMVDQRRTTSTPDLLSDLMSAEVDGDRLTHGELLNLAATLLMAGTDTTRNQLAAAVDVFCDHPDQWQRLAEEPHLAPAAVEETMRYRPAILTTIRQAVEDVAVDALTIPAGTLVIVNTAAANRDPAVYAEPERFDITRQSGLSMLTFGSGAHFCIGSHLARVELAEALSTLARRMPNLRRTGPAPWKPMTGITGPVTLPVAFDGG